ncbi:transposase, partial [Algoriphagus sp. H41]
ILNTDQGSQFTSEVFTATVKSSGIRLSMDGKGRAIDNVFIERFWRTIKYEKIYLNPPRDGLDLYALVAEYTDYYNHRRRHSSLDHRIPAEVYSLVEQVA